MRLTTNEIRTLKKAGWRVVAVCYGPPKPLNRVSHFFAPGYPLPANLPVPPQRNPKERAQEYLRGEKHKYTGRTGKRVLSMRQNLARTVRQRHLEGTPK